MFNLIKRDAIIQKNQLLVFIPFILFFVFMNTNPTLIFLVASIFIPFNAYAYDEKAETNILLNSLPYTRKEIIAARYIGALVYMLISVALTSIALFIFNKPFTFSQIGMGVSIFVLFSAITFPIFYIFKQGHISIFIMMSFLLLATVGPTIAHFLFRNLPVINQFTSQISTPIIYISVLFIVLVAYLSSWLATTYIYQRKSF